MFTFNLVQKVNVLFEDGGANRAGELAKEIGAKKAMLVYDKGIAATGLLEPIFKGFNDNGVDYIKFDGVVADPPEEVVDVAVEIC